MISFATAKPCGASLSSVYFTNPIGDSPCPLRMMTWMCSGIFPSVRYQKY